MDTDEVLALLQEVAAQVVTPRFRTLTDAQVMEKNPGDLVTVADREAEVLITRRLREAYPDALVVGEEAVSADKSILNRLAGVGPDTQWFTVDPVDGTKNFVEGSPDYATMVAEARGQDVVRAWIWQPTHEVSWVAERGAGVRRSGTATRPATRDNAHLRGRISLRRRVGMVLGDGALAGPLTLTWASCGIDYPRLVEGAADFVLYRGANPWDHAPGELLLRESGGEVTHWDGTPYDPRSTRHWLLAAGSEQVADLVRPLLPPPP